MKTRLILMAFILSNLFCMSQEKFLILNHEILFEKFNHYVGELYQAQLSPNYDSDSYLFSMGIFSASYCKINNKHLSEISLMPFFIQQRNYETRILIYDNHPHYLDGETIQFMKSYLSYNYSLLLRNNENKFLPYIGLGSSLNWNYNHYKPYISNNYMRRIFSIEIDFACNLGYIHRIKENVYMKMNIPFTFYSHSWSFDKIYNPTIPEKLRTKTSINNEFLPNKYSIQFGIGFKL